MSSNRSPAATLERIERQILRTRREHTYAARQHCFVGLAVLAANSGKALALDCMGASSLAYSLNYGAVDGTLPFGLLRDEWDMVITRVSGACVLGAVITM